MPALEILRKKRDGGTLTASEIQDFIAGVTHGSWADYQVSALLMAIVCRGMNAEETAHLTRAMVESGQRLAWPDLHGPKVDKHSTGGVGDKTSLILAPLAAACGVVVPMMSGRGLGHTGGTLDKLEAIPGFRVHLSAQEARPILRDLGLVLIGATHDIAPADRILYALRDVTATVESIPLITASILSKKIAEGIDGLVLDVKCGHGAFMKQLDDSLALARSLASTGQANGVRTRALITSMEAPLGLAVGNALEVQEAIDTLKGRGPEDVEELSVILAAEMVALGGLAKSRVEAEEKVRAALRSGEGLEKFRLLIERQGGDPRVIDDPGRLPQARQQALIRSPRSGYVESIAAETVGRATMVLGAGRSRVDDRIDPAVGAVLLAKPGQQIRAGDPLAKIFANVEVRMEQAWELFEEAWTIGEEPPTPHTLVLETVG